MTASDLLHALWTWTPFLGEGFLWNILISAVAMAVGTPLGYGLARLRLTGSRSGAWLTAAARVPPTFVLIYYLAYVLPREIAIGDIVLSVPDWLKASLALSVAVTGFVSDNALASLRHRHRGEWVEALYFIPAWTTYFLIIIMASSTASVIGVPEIVQRANTVIAAIGDPGAILWVYLYTMAWFLALCWPLALLMRHAKVRLARQAGSMAGARRDFSDLDTVAEQGLLTLPDADQLLLDDPIGDEWLELPVAFASIPDIQIGVERASEGVLDSAAVFRLTLAIEELVTNLVKYGDAAGTTIRVNILKRPREVTVELDFGGSAFDPFRDAPAPALDAPIEERPIGGLGIHLVTEMIDRAYYRRIGERNIVRLVMLRPAAASEGHLA